MNKNNLSPDLDLLCKALCNEVLHLSDYKKLTNHDLNKISSFLIQFNPDFSSSRESLTKSLHNWFSGKNAPSASKLEDISKSLGFAGYHDFINHNRRKIQTSRIKQSIVNNPFQKVLGICGLGLILALISPLMLGIDIQQGLVQETESGELLASVIQAVVVIAFYLLSRFSDFGGRDRIRNTSNALPLEARSSLQQFFKGWNLLWLSFSFLYIWFCILYGFKIHTDPYAQSVSDIITIFSSLCFAYLFSVMDVESIPRMEAPRKVKTFYTYLTIFTIGLTTSSLMSILDRYYNLGFLDGAGTYLLGYANVIVMLYFFGRLESHFLNVNRFVLMPLYTYAIIQIAYVLFFAGENGEQSYEAYIIGTVLLLKGFLFFLIREWIKEGKMENYFLKQYEKSRVG